MEKISYDEPDSSLDAAPLLEEKCDGGKNIGREVERRSCKCCKVLCWIIAFLSLAVYGVVLARTQMNNFWHGQEIIQASGSARYLFTFGDSYTSTEFDVWGEPPSPTNPFGNPLYPGKTTCNGPNWLGNVVHSLSRPAPMTYNYAVVGAVVDNQHTPDASTPVSFLVQADLFQMFMAPGGESQVAWDGDNSAFVIWFGQNDLALTWAAQNWSTTMAPVFDKILNSYFQQVDRLYFAGAKKFVFIALETSISQTPLWHEEEEYVRNLIESDTNIWNAELQNRAVMFAGAHEEVIVEVLDIAPAFQRVLAHPELYGASVDASCENEDGISCVWVDWYHPGQAIHRETAKLVYGALSRVGFYSRAD